MSTVRQVWLVARRELRERGRSNAFRFSLAVMVIAVAAMIALPKLIGGSTTRDVGLAGAAPPALSQALESQGAAAGAPIVVHRYDSRTAGEQAVRNKRIDVLVVDAQVARDADVTARLEWPRQVDDKLKSDVVAAMQVVAIRQRADAAGMSEAELAALLSPVAVTDDTLGVVAGRSTGDEIAALVMTGVMMFVIATFGSMVLSGVVEEKASRVVEVLLSRVAARTLLAGKIAGIGLLGLAQVAVTALAAFVAVKVVGTDLPSVRPTVLAWSLVWFVLGYALYATAFGVLGSLASRVEDAQSTAGPLTVVLMVGYFACFAAIGSPESTWATLISLFPPTAPMAMPSRIALGVTAWWEPLVAVALTLLSIVGLVRFGGRLYVAALLHSGAPLSLRAAWRRTTERSAEASAPRPVPTASATVVPPHRLQPTVLMTAGVALGAIVALLTNDVIVGVIVGGAFIAVSRQLVRLWSGHGGGRPRHP